MHSARTHDFAQDGLDRHSVGNRASGPVYGPDGSLDVCLQRDEPTGPGERVNRLPAPDGPFRVVRWPCTRRPAITTDDRVPQGAGKR
jgi:hypothetical protein